jgi:hypothetical protein
MKATFKPPVPEVEETNMTVQEFYQLLEAARLAALLEAADDTTD